MDWFLMQDLNNKYALTLRKSVKKVVPDRNLPIGKTKN